MGGRGTGEFAHVHPHSIRSEALPVGHGCSAEPCSGGRLVAPGAYPAQHHAAALIDEVPVKGGLVIEFLLGDPEGTFRSGMGFGAESEKAGQS